MSRRKKQERPRVGGRRFAEPWLMQKAVDEYFDSLEVFDEEGNVSMVKPPTQSGLARALGFRNVGSLFKYEGYDGGDFQAVIDDAKLRLQEPMEHLIMSGKSTVWNLLKSADKDHWKDRTEQAVEMSIDERPPLERAEMLAKIRAKREQRALQMAEAQEEDDDWIG